MTAATYPLTLFFDGECPLCIAEVTNLRLRDVDQQLRFKDVHQLSDEDLPLGVSRQQSLSRIHAQCADGRVIDGVEVFRLAYQAAQMAWFGRYTRMPMLSPLVEGVYFIFAKYKDRLPKSVSQKIADLLFKKAIQNAAEQAAAKQCTLDSCGLTRPGMKEQQPTSINKGSDK